MAAALGMHVGVDNDVNLAAVAERQRGVGRDADGFALLWLGEEGLGLAIDVGGTLLRGARGGAGEIGYMPLFAPDSTERKVDLQDLVGGPAVLALARTTASRRHPGRGVAARPPTRAAGEFFAQLADRVAVGLAAVIAVLDPPLVVLAGQVAQAGGRTLLAAVTARSCAPLRWRARSPSPPSTTTRCCSARSTPGSPPSGGLDRLHPRQPAFR
jgi:predicted NBD/HSP70 family sugar kinase